MCSKKKGKQHHPAVWNQPWKIMIIASLHSIKITIRQNFNTSAGASLVDPTAITFEINVHSTCKQSLWSYLISKGCLNEAEKNFICFSGLFGFGLVHDAHHLINPFRQQCEALHLVDVMSVLVSLSPPASHNNTICLKDFHTVSARMNEWMNASKHWVSDQTDFDLFSSCNWGLVLWLLSPIFVPSSLPTRDRTSPVGSSLRVRSIRDLSACNTKLEFCGGNTNIHDRLNDYVSNPSDLHL